MAANKMDRLDLYGRTAEQAAIRGLLDGVRTSGSGVLVIRGQAGIGKSALLQDAVDSAADMQVLRSQGVETEVALPFAALHQLLRPLLAGLDRLPAHHALALRRALGIEPPGGQDGFLVALATLGLLADAAENAPVLCVVDDAHWLDEASVTALLFVARRLGAERVVMLFAARDDDMRGFPAAGLPELRLAGLDRESAERLLADRANAPVVGHVRDWLVEQTGGNPLALRELPGALTREQLTGAQPLPATLPLTEGIWRLFTERIERLPVPVRTAVLVAAAEESGQLSAVLPAATALGAPAEALDLADRAGLVHMLNGTIQFRHPLVRSAAYQAASAAERRAAHHALAQVFSSAGDADRRAWHLSAAAVEPDESVATELEQAAGRAGGRGGFQAAGAALERAAALTANAEQRCRRLVSAAESYWRAGQLSRANGLLQAARPLAPTSQVSADIGQLRAWYELTAGSPNAAQQIFLDAANEVAPVDGCRARRLLAAGATAAWMSSDRELTNQYRSAAATLGPVAGGRDQFFADELDGFLHYIDGDLIVGIRLIARAIGLAERLDDPELLVLAAHHAFDIGDDAAAQRLNARVVAQARAAGAVTDVLFALPRLAQAELVAGRWTAAAASAAEAVRLAGELGHPELGALPLAWLALLAALRGDADEFWSLTDRTNELAEAHPLGILGPAVRDVIQWSEAVRKLAGGRPATAVVTLERITHPVVAGMAAVDRIEAAALTGRRHDVQRWLEPLKEFAAGSGAEWALARAAYAQALLSTGAVAEDQFRTALDHHQRATRPFEKARVHLAYGEFLRRGRQRVAAREQLNVALDVFESLGASPWAERARTELRACGQTARRRRDPSTLRQLTPQEVQVARFVARGLPTREVAAQLFLSPRTIEFHLRNVFAKLGISSRAELASVDLE